MAITLQRIDNTLILSDPASSRWLATSLLTLFGILLSFYGLTNEFYNNGLFVISGALIFILGLFIFRGIRSRIITFDIRSQKITITSRSLFGKITEAIHPTASYHIVEFAYVLDSNGGGGYTLELVGDEGAEDYEDEDDYSILLNENGGPIIPWFGGRARLVKVGQEIATYLGVPLKEMRFWQR